jgi:hypothetical protein
LGRNRIINLKAVFRKNILRAATSCADTCQYATLQAEEFFHRGADTVFSLLLERASSMGAASLL